MPIVHGLRVSFEARTSIRSTTIYLNSTVHYIVPDRVPDTGVRRVNNTDKVPAFRELSCECVNVWAQ